MLDCGVMEPKSRKWLVQKTLVVSAALLLTCGLAALVPGVPELPEVERGDGPWNGDLGAVVRCGYCCR